MTKLLHIQFLRGLAALSVAFLHAQHDAGSLAERSGQSFKSLTSLPFMAGVDVFFVISGFIMVYASRSLFGSVGAPGLFLQRRVARIAPLYWAVTTLYLAVATVAPFVLNQPQPSAWLVIASYLFVPAVRGDGLVQPIYSLGWTLNYEMFFYVLFALCLVLPLRAALTRLLALLAGLALFGAVLPLPQPLAFWTNPIILEFAFGAGLGWLQIQGFVLRRDMRWALVLLALAFLLAAGSAGGSSALGRPFLWGLPAAMLVAAAALGKEHSGPVSAFTRLCAFLGDISYAIYLIHPFVIRGMGEIIVRAGLAPVIGPLGFIALSLTGTIIAAWSVHRVFERPATEFLRKRLARSPA